MKYGNTIVALMLFGFIAYHIFHLGKTVGKNNRSELEKELQESLMNDYNSLIHTDSPQDSVYEVERFSEVVSYANFVWNDSIERLSVNGIWGLTFGMNEHRAARIIAPKVDSIKHYSGMSGYGANAFGYKWDEATLLFYEGGLYEVSFWVYHKTKERVCTQYEQLSRFLQDTYLKSRDNSAYVYKTEYRMCPPIGTEVYYVYNNFLFSYRPLRSTEIRLDSCIIGPHGDLSLTYTDTYLGRLAAWEEEEIREEMENRY